MLMKSVAACLRMLILLAPPEYDHQLIEPDTSSTSEISVCDAVCCAAPEAGASSSVMPTKLRKIDGTSIDALTAT